jgi:hypothetical protein
MQTFHHKHNISHAGRSIIALLLFLLLVSCQKSSEPVRQATLDSVVVATDSTAQGYVLEQQRGCFCPDNPGLVRLKVINEEIVEGIVAGSGEPLDEQTLKWYKSIGDLNTFVKKLKQSDPAVLNLKYDTVLGYIYPSYIFVDRDRELADEEIVYETRLVELIQ